MCRKCMSFLKPLPNDQALSYFTELIMEFILTFERIEQIILRLKIRSIY